MYDEKMLPNSNREAVIGEVKCTGKESELLICSHLSIGQYNCSYYHAKPVAIKCSSGEVLHYVILALTDYYNNRC